MEKKKFFKRTLAFVMGAATLLSTGCNFGKPTGNNGDSVTSGATGHQHEYVCKVNEADYLKSEKSCSAPATYYYSCACGEKGEETYTVGTKATHDYSAEVAAEEYLNTAATCQAQAVYYRSCVTCGRSSAPYGVTFSAGELGDHVYDQEKTGGEYIATEATYETAATYYKSCLCGKAGTEETFSYGDPIKQLTEDEKKNYVPVSLTMGLYDTENSIYGFTYNTQAEPMRPVIQYEKGTQLTENALEVGSYFSKHSSYAADDSKIDYYIVKAEIELEPATTYTYRIYDKYADVASETVTFKTRDASATSFTFSHVSDTQSVPSSGLCFREVLSQMADNTDFILHTGDVVEYSKYEYEWTDMLHANFEYLSKTPIMAIAGNHDTTYKSGVNEMWKHFSNKIPTQKSILAGYYYTFTYSNVKFIMLNTNNSSGALDKEQYDWLVKELANNDSDWTIVAMHAPLYSIGQWGAHPEKNQQSVALRAQLQSVFAEYGVDLVLQGHDHLVSKTNALDGEGKPTTETKETVAEVEYTVDPSGVIYVMDGTVGTNLKGVVGIAEGIYDYAQACGSRTWADITIDGDTLTYEVKNYSGTLNILQKWGIKKTGDSATENA
ncbi:MAG: metallophosphoesterase family protein [Clostridia bacterium]|nr:metallophosphoesterase family protein [Clostridia bacterium]